MSPAPLCLSHVYVPGKAEHSEDVFGGDVCRPPHPRGSSAGVTRIHEYGASKVRPKELEQCTSGRRGDGADPKLLGPPAHAQHLQHREERSQVLSHPLSLWGRSTAFCPCSSPPFPLLGICHGEGVRRAHLSSEVLETKSDTGPSFRRGLLSQLPSPCAPQGWAHSAPLLQSHSPLTETKALEPRAEHSQLQS